MGWTGWWTRSILSDPEIPNDNDPAAAAPGTVGPPSTVPGDPHGLEVVEPDTPSSPPPIIRPSAWSGWPAEWWTPNWQNRANALTDTAWICVDKNSWILSEMTPYLVNAAPSTNADWLTNPNPDIYYGWPEFMKQAAWDLWAVGETFILATSRYSNGYPARFHVVAPWYVNVEMDAGRRRYSIGQVDVTGDMLHLRYQSTVDDAHGHGPLEAIGARVVAAQVLVQYASTLAAGGGIPHSLIEVPDQPANAEQAAELKAAWVQARASSIGEPAVLFGGIKWSPVQVNPKDMALIELEQHNESRIAVALGVPPYLVGLPSGGDSMTYSNVNAIFDYHWRDGLRPKANAISAALSGWLLPRGTTVEFNQDKYVQPEPLQRAQTAQILNSIKDETGKPVLSVERIQQAERIDNANPQEGALR